MNRDQKSAVIDEIAAQIEEAEAIFAVDYRGITVTQAAELRGRLREADATFRIVKNSLTERAAEKAGVEGLKALLEGPTAFTFVRGDAAVAAKALADFARGSDSFSFKGGRLGAEELTIEQITSIARLPAREVLHAQLVGMIAAPITGLVRGLNALIAGVAIQLRQIADQGLVSGAEPEPPAAETEPETQAPAAEAPAAQEPAAEAEAPAEEPTAEADAEAPTEAEEQSSPVDEVPAEAAPDQPDVEPEAAAEEAAPEATTEDDNEADASAQADDDTSAEAAKED